MAAPRMTVATQRVLRVLLEQPDREWYGAQIATATRHATGTIHPILARLERAGWLESRLENIDPSAAGRPRRRYYRLSPDGAGRAQSALADVPISDQAPTLADMSADSSPALPLTGSTQKMDTPEPVTLWDLAREFAKLTPEITAAKAGTEHEGHDGWGMGAGPGRVQCGCGASLDDVLGFPPAETFHIAHCVECEMRIPFGSEPDRDGWADGHAATGHKVVRYEEIR